MIIVFEIDICKNYIAWCGIWTFSLLEKNTSSLCISKHYVLEACHHVVGVWKNNIRQKICKS